MPEMDTGDTAWILASAALVMFMTPGLALFYGGLVRSKNVLGTIMQSFFALGLVSVLFMMFGYTLAFGTDVGSIIGGLRFCLFERRRSGAVCQRSHHPAQRLHDLPDDVRHHHPRPDHRRRSRTHEVQGLCDVPGARGRSWSTPPSPTGCGAAAGSGLPKAWRPRLRRRHRGPHQRRHCGAGLHHLHGQAQGLPAARRSGRTTCRWRCSAPASSGSAGSGSTAAAPWAPTASPAPPSLRPISAAAAALLGWLIPEWIQHKAPTTIGAATGAVAGLVAITPAAGFVEPWAAVVIGFAGGLVCYIFVSPQAQARLRRLARRRRRPLRRRDRREHF